MKKRGILVLAIVVLNLSVPFIFAGIDDEINKLAHYAEEYETGNIDYIRLVLYTSSVREKLNEDFGAISREHGGIFKQEQIKKILGESNEVTRWVWVEKEERERILANPVPVWEKIVFDGKKIQIRLNSYPTLFVREFLDDSKEYEGNSEEELIYRLNFDVDFKKPKEQLDVESKIGEIKKLAENFNSNPSQENAEILAKESVNAEKAFDSFFRQSNIMCEEIMQDIFGSENQREKQKTLVQEISFFEEDNFVVMANLEMCDECNWNWINLHFWIDGRGPGFKMPEETGDKGMAIERYKNLDPEQYKREVNELIESMKSSFAQSDFESAFSYMDRLRELNDAWNEKANNVWEEADKMFRSEYDNNNNDKYHWIKIEQKKREKMKEIRKKNYEERKKFYLELFSEYYGRTIDYNQESWEKRLVEEFKEFGEEICDNNKDDNNNGKIDCEESQCGGKFAGVIGVNEMDEAGETKENVIQLFCIGGERKPKEETIEKKEAVCGNHICEIGENGESIENLTDGEIEKWKNESGYCPQDCSICPEHNPIECKEFEKAIFMGEDENGCPLSPICIEEDSCQTDNDCKFRCGIGKCIFEDGNEIGDNGKCVLAELSECKEAECIDGDEKIQNCDSGGHLIVEICEDGYWKDTGLECEKKSEELECFACGNECLPKESVIAAICPETTEEFYCIEKSGKCVISGFEEPISEEKPIEEKSAFGEECITIEDCGGKNDVCSNGFCESIPEIAGNIFESPGEFEEEYEIEIEEEVEEDREQFEPGINDEIEEAEELGVEPIKTNEAEVTGNVVFNFFGILKGVFNPRITGRAVEGESEVAEQPAESPPVEEREVKQFNDCEDVERGCGGVCGPCPEDEEERRIREEKGFEGEQKRFENEERGREKREQGDMERMCKERCDNQCEELNVRCVEDCVFIKNSEELRDLNECREKCDNEKKEEVDSCRNSCFDKCIKGEEIEFRREEPEHKEEKGVFNAGGMCRIVKGKKEGFIYFNGWGDPFEKIERLKHKYYSGGDADWCKWDLENLIKQRKEFEKGFNYEFAKWFFEKYLANSAEDWEGHISGIYEIYWSNVDNQRELAFRMECLRKNDITEFYNPNLINFSYDTEFGSIEYWEELKVVSIHENKESKIVSPYMKIWIFPPEKFIQSEMKKAMKEHEFPGPPEEKLERKNQEGLTEEEKRFIKMDEKFMEKISEISEKYGGELITAVQFKDFDTNEIVFNVEVKVSPEDILAMEPKLPEEISEKDVTMTINFNEVYELIKISEKDMRGSETEYPPWDRKPVVRSSVNEFVNGIKMFFKVRKIINNAEIQPSEAEKDIRKMTKEFFSMMMKSDGDNRNEPTEQELKEINKEFNDGELKDFWDSKEQITGEVIG